MRMKLEAAPKRVEPVYLACVPLSKPMNRSTEVGLEFCTGSEALQDAAPPHSLDHGRVFRRLARPGAQRRSLRANDGETSESLKFSLEGEGQPSWSCNTRKLIPTVLPGLVVTGDRA